MSLLGFDELPEGDEPFLALQVSAVECSAPVSPRVDLRSMLGQKRGELFAIFKS